MSKATLYLIAFIWLIGGLLTAWLAVLPTYRWLGVGIVGITILAIGYDRHA